MVRFILIRLLEAVVLIWAVSTFTFFLIHSAPGLPTIAVNLEQTLQDRERVIAELGLDKPITEQYIQWLSNALHGDLGTSLTYRGTSVLQLVLPALVPTLILAGIAFFVAVALAIPMGILAATHRGSIIDYTINLFAALGLALPGFWLGLILIIVFAIQLRWLPTSGYPSGSDEGIVGLLRYVTLPAIVLVTGLLAPLARQMRSSMLEELNQDYLRTARAKGIHETTILYRHAIKNSLFPVIALMATQIPLLIGGSAVIESLFAWPGMGRLAVNSAFQRDYPTVLAITIIIAAIAILSNLVVDLFYARLDPRVRL